MGCCLLNLSPLNRFDRRRLHNACSAFVDLFLRVLAIVIILLLNRYHPHPHPPPSEGEGTNSRSHIKGEKSIPEDYF